MADGREILYIRDEIAVWRTGNARATTTQLYNGTNKKYRPMSSRAFRILFIAFQAFWLNVVLPGHTRGEVTLPCSMDRGCEVAVSTRPCCAATGKQAPGAPTPDQKSRCAICFFAAHVTPPPVVDFAPVVLELLYVRPVASPHSVESADIRLTYLGRAPPAAV